MSSLSFSTERLDWLRRKVASDVESGVYWGGAFKIARHGKVEFDEAIGYEDSAHSRSLATNSVFSLLSITKAFTNVLVLRAIEQGRFSFTTKMVDLIPEFKGTPRDKATIYHFLTHTTGMPGVWVAKPGGTPTDDLSAAVEAVCQFVQGNIEPGVRCDYSPMANHTLLAEVLRRTDPHDRGFVSIVREDLFEPLGMVDTHFGVPATVRDRFVFPDRRGMIGVGAPYRENDDNPPAPYNDAPYNELAHSGASSTTGDLMRFAEMLRNGGELDGVRILSPRMIRMARQNQTGDLPNELYMTVALRAGYDVPPAYMGLGFNLRGPKLCAAQFGTMTSAETFGNYGSGSTVFWVDPEHDITFVGLTAGLMDQAQNITRFQQLADIVMGAAL